MGEGTEKSGVRRRERNYVCVLDYRAAHNTAAQETKVWVDRSMRVGRCVGS